MGSNVKPRLIDAAITLFGQYGLYGVTTLELAKKAQVIEGSLYRLFLTKEKLYDAAIESVVRATTDALAQFVLTLYAGAAKEQDIHAQLAAAVWQWHSALTQDGARLLLQATVSNKSLAAYALSPNQQLTEILITMLDRKYADSRMQHNGFDTRTAAESLVLALFQLKVSTVPELPGTEPCNVERCLQHWLQQLPCFAA
jgi:AcrR family transcriptional regulator